MELRGVLFRSGRIAAVSDKGVILEEESVEVGIACKAARTVERRQIGAHLFLRQRRIVRRQPAVCKEGVIGVQRAHIVGIDRQSGEAVRRPAARQIGKIARQQVGVRTQQAVKLARSRRSEEEHTSELQSLMRTSYAVFCLKKKKKQP